MGDENAATWAVVAHLPDVRLPDDCTEAWLGPVPLRAFTFDEWQQLDDALPFQDRRFTASRPCFVHAAVRLPAGLDVLDGLAAGADPLTGLVTQVHRALLLATGLPLLDPRASLAYVLPPGAAGTVINLAGLAGLELVVFADHRSAVELDDDLLAAAAERLGLLDGPLPEAVDDLAETLAATTLPGTGPLLEAARLVAAWEGLLVGDGEPATRTFARRSAVLIVADGADPAVLVEPCRALYGLRSDVVHGRTTHTARSGTAGALLDAVRPVSCGVLVRVLRWLRSTGGDLPALRDALDRAFADPLARAGLLATTGSGR